MYTVKVSDLPNVIGYYQHVDQNRSKPGITCLVIIMQNKCHLAFMSNLHLQLKGRGKLLAVCDCIE